MKCLFFLLSLLINFRFYAVVAGLRGAFLIRKQPGIRYLLCKSNVSFTKKLNVANFEKLTFPKCQFFISSNGHMKSLLRIRFYQHFKVFSIILNILQHFLNFLIIEDAFSLKNLIKSGTLFCG